MQPRPDKDRRKQLLREVKLRGKAAAHAALPLSNADLQALFDILDARLPIEGCDRSRRLTIEFLKHRSLPEGSVLEWLDSTGGFCDCEVVYNSRQKWLACKDYKP
jgi:Protein of unknown function (DUF2695)